MTDKHPTPYLANVANIAMDPKRRDEMRRALSEYADFHAVAEGVRIEEAERSSVRIQHSSVWSGLFTQRTLRSMYLNATLLIALMVSGGTAVAAQGALPGDTLYPVKLHVNENVRSAFAVGANAQARLEAELLKERVEEAETLATEGRLEGDAAIDVTSRITAQARATADAAAAADAETSAAVRTDLALSLGATGGAAMEATTGAAASAVAGLDSTIDAALGILAASENDVDAATELAGEVNLEARIESAGVRADGLERTIAAEAELEASARAAFAARIVEAREHIAEARASIREEAQAAAEASVSAADSLLGEIESKLSLMGDVEIDTDTGAIIDINLHEADVEADSETDARGALDLNL